MPAPLHKASHWHWHPFTNTHHFFLSNSGFNLLCSIRQYDNISLPPTRSLRLSVQVLPLAVDSVGYFTWSYLFLLGLTHFYLVILGLARFYWSYTFLLGLTRFHYLFICLGLDTGMLMANLPYIYISACSYRPIYRVRISSLKRLSRLISK
jgi:hypothetical protein